MSMTLRRFVFTLAAVAAIAPSAAAQQPGSVVGDLMTDINQVRDKLIGLAKTVPVDKYDWRPSLGVRSIGEVFLHVASDNYLMPSAFGVAPDPATGINTSDFKTLGAFEKQKLGRDAMVAALEKSFAHLDKAMRETPADKLGAKIKFFGQDFSGQRIWIMTATHLHEHLGQSIAYARSNNIVPPWSK
jgi:hypothetical protein